MCVCVLSVYGQEAFFVLCWNQLLFKWSHLPFGSWSLCPPPLLSTTSNTLGAARFQPSLYKWKSDRNSEVSHVFLCLGSFYFLLLSPLSCKMHVQGATTLNSQMGIRHYSWSCPGLSRSLSRSVIQPTCTRMIIWVDWASLLIGQYLCSSGC